MDPDELVIRRALIVIVPCRDEADGVADLVGALGDWAVSERDRRRLRFVFVDDGSVDGTRTALQAALAGHPCDELADARIESHHPARGLTAALRAGLGAARAESDDSVAWLDADLTYPPELLGALADRVDHGADIGVASPYHPDGGVEGVPGWRLVLSRAASAAWRLAAGVRIHTLTSMVRVWRADWLTHCEPRSGGFLGVTESLVRAARAGARIEEVAAVLRRRRTGQSKMRIVQVAFGHLRLMVACRFGTLGPRHRGADRAVVPTPTAASEPP